MQFNQIISMALRSLQANKVRSFLTMLGVIIGVASVILLVSVGSGLQKYISNQLEGIGSNLILIVPGKLDLKKVSQGGGPTAGLLTSKLTSKDAKDLVSNSSFIKAAAPGTTAQAAIKYGTEKMFSQVVGITANYPEIMNSPLALGEHFTETDDRGGRRVAVIGSEVAKTLFKSDDPLNKKISIGDTKFTVIGVLNSRGLGGASEDHVVIPITVAMRIFNQQKVQVIYAQANNAEQVDQAIAEAKTILLNRLTEDDFTILTQKDILGAVSSILGTLTVALGGIAAISLIVGGIGIMNIMLVSVTERTHEIGLRKALGATPNVILMQFLIEAIVLSAGGGIIGILIGGGGALLLSSVIPSQVTFWAVLLAFSVSFIIGIIFGVMPARKASRMSPIEALRYE